MAITSMKLPEASGRQENGLANVFDASINDLDVDTTSEEEIDSPYDEFSQADNVIGVSISHVQTHLADPKTPAVEKAAALEQGGGYFALDDIVDIDESTDTLPDKVLSSEREFSGLVAINGPAGAVFAPTTAGHGVQKEQLDGHQDKPVNEPALDLPSPWRAGPKRFQIEPPGSGAGKVGQRLRSGSEKSSSIPAGFRMKLPFNLQSLTKGPAFFNARKDEHDAESQKNLQHAELGPGLSNKVDSTSSDESLWTRMTARRTTITNGVSPNDSSSNATLTSGGRPVDNPASNTPDHIPHSTLKRTYSDDSLFLQRALSTASSLGDDKRFENVSEMVNSRLKAIKDSMHDSNFKLPSLPKASNFKFGSFMSDLGNNRDEQAGQSDRGRVREGSAVTAASASPSTRKVDSSARSPAAPSHTPAGMTAASAAMHPNFAKALERMTGDVVILGGYRGSILREAQSPNRRLWIPLKAGLNLRKVDLEVGFSEEDEERMHETVIADGMLTHIGPVDISRRLLKRLRACDNVLNGKLRVHEYGYDWRLSPHRLSAELLKFVEKLPSNQPGVPREQQGALMIAHSLGGLITRYAVNQRPELFSGVIYAGTPQHCVNILGPFRKGDDVLLSSKVLTAQVNFSIRTSFALLPLNGFCFIDKDTKEEYPVDFFNVQDWIEHRWSPCTDPALPALTPPRNGSISSLVSTMTSALPPSLAKALPDTKAKAASSAQTSASETKADGGAPKAGMAPQMGSSSSPPPTTANPTPSAGTTVTLPRADAIDYLTRTLAATKQFKQALEHNPALTKRNAYPPFAVIYGKTTPTVYGAKVRGRDSIRRADAYDDLAFASGDGVVLARAAMLPDGYRAVKGGVVASERGHVSLLGDLEGVGRAILAVGRARREGVGLGVGEELGLGDGRRK